VAVNAAEQTARRRLKDRLTAGCLLGSALALLAADVISPVMSSSDAHQLEIVAAHGPRQYISAVLALVALALLLPAGLGLAGRMRGRWASYGILGAGLLTVGVVATATATALALVEWRASRPGLDRGQMTQLLHQLDTNTGIASVFIAGIGVPLGLVVLAVGLVRDKVLSATLGVLLVAGPTIVDAGFTVNNLTVAIIGSAVMVVGFALVARALIARDEGRAARAGGPAVEAAS
jgi:hypothetical protein